jgi:hypothetical protein
VVVDGAGEWLGLALVKRLDAEPDVAELLSM